MTLKYVLRKSWLAKLEKEDNVYLLRNYSSSFLSKET